MIKQLASSLTKIKVQVWVTSKSIIFPLYRFYIYKTKIPTIGYLFRHAWGTNVNSIHFLPWRFLSSKITHSYYNQDDTTEDRKIDRHQNHAVSKTWHLMIEETRFPSTTKSQCMISKMYICRPTNKVINLWEYQALLCKIVRIRIFVSLGCQEVQMRDYQWKYLSKHNSFTKVSFFFQPRIFSVIC